MISGRTQILPNGEHIFDTRQIAKDLEQFVHLFAQADDHAGLGDQRGSTIFAYSSSEGFADSARRSDDA